MGFSALLLVACSGGESEPASTSTAMTTPTAEASETPAGATSDDSLPRAEIVWPGDTEAPHFVAVAGEAVVDGDLVEVTFRLDDEPPPAEGDLLLYIAMLYFEGQDHVSQAMINIAGGPSWYIGGSTALLFLHDSESGDPTRPTTLPGSLVRDPDQRTFTLATRLPGDWPAVEVVQIVVSRFVAPREAVEVTGPSFEVPVRTGSVSALAAALRVPDDVPFPPPLEGLGDPATFPVQLPLPADWEHTHLAGHGYDAAEIAGGGLAGVTIVADGDPATLLDTIVSESDGAYVLEERLGPIGIFEAAVRLRATREYQVSPADSSVFTGGWYSLAGNSLVIAAVTHEGITYVAYVEVPEGEDVAEWYPILADATFR